MTRNQKYFAVLTILLSLVFFKLLIDDLTIEAYGNLWIYALIYGIVMFLNGLYFGYNDPVRETRHDLGFQYHLITYIIVNVIGINWFIFKFADSGNAFFWIVIQCVPWGLGVLLHYYLSLRCIKGMDKEEIFV